MQGIHMLNDRQNSSRSKRWSMPSPRSVDFALIGFVVVVLALAWRFGPAGDEGDTRATAPYAEVLKSHISPVASRQKRTP